MIIGIIVDYFAAREFNEIANCKGFEGNKYFWWTFLVLPIGSMMVIALPDHAKTNAAAAPKPLNTQKEDDELPDL